MRGNLGYSPKLIHESSELAAEAHLGGKNLPATALITCVLLDKSNAKAFYDLGQPFRAGWIRRHPRPSPR